MAFLKQGDTYQNIGIPRMWYVGTIFKYNGKMSAIAYPVVISDLCFK